MFIASRPLHIAYCTHFSNPSLSLDKIMSAPAIDSSAAAVGMKMQMEQLASMRVLIAGRFHALAKLMAEDPTFKESTDGQLLYRTVAAIASVEAQVDTFDLNEALTQVCATTTASEGVLIAGQGLQLLIAKYNTVANGCQGFLRLR